MYWLLVIWTGKLIIQSSRIAGNSGSALPGLIIEKLYPKFIARAVKQLSGGVVLITGTNGKTTTNKLLAGIAASSGRGIVTNRAGGNLSRGIASVLLDHMNFWGKIDADLGLFEVDEAFLPDVAQKTRPQTIVVLNLLRDQLDRYGELDRTAGLIGRGLKYAKQTALNSDDPLVAGLSGDLKRQSLIYFGATPSLQDRLPHDAELFGRKVKGLRSRRANKPDFELVTARSSGGRQRLEVLHRGTKYPVHIKLPGVYNALNAVAAIAAASQVGIKPSEAIVGIRDVGPAFGRTELIKVKDKSLQLLLVKNPAGFNQVIDNFLSRSKNQPVLMAVNDNFADGRDVSWLWDVDFEKLSNYQPQIITSGIRGYDMALRLKYAQLAASTELDLDKALKAFIKSVPAGEVGYIVPTYTAMLSLRKALKKEAKLAELWR